MIFEVVLNKSVEHYFRRYIKNPLPHHLRQGILVLISKSELESQFLQCLDKFIHVRLAVRLDDCKNRDKDDHSRQQTAAERRILPLFDENV